MLWLKILKHCCSSFVKNKYIILSTNSRNNVSEKFQLPDTIAHPLALANIRLFYSLSALDATDSRHLSGRLTGSQTYFLGLFFHDHALEVKYGLDAAKNA